MASPMVVADASVNYDTKEAAIIVAALAFCIALGGVVVAAIVLCGWRGAKSVSTNWYRGRVTFNCR